MPPKKSLTREQFLAAKAAASAKQAQASLQTVEQLLNEKRSRALVLQTAIQTLAKGAARHDSTKLVLQQKQRDLGLLLKEIVTLKLRVDYLQRQTQRARTSEEQLVLAQTMVDVARVTHASNKLSAHVFAKVPNIGKVLERSVESQTELLQKVETEFDSLNMDPETLELTGEVLDTDPDIMSEKEAGILSDLGLLDAAGVCFDPANFGAEKALLEALPEVPTHRISSHTAERLSEQKTPSFQLKPLPEVQDPDDLFSI